MSDSRLRSDLCVLAVKRAFAIDFEKLMNNLHKNSKMKSCNICLYLRPPPPTRKKVNFRQKIEN